MKHSKKELFYNEIADEWEHVGTYKSETNKRLKVVFEELLNGINIKNKKFLDAGCGLGYFSKVAVSKNASVTGIDIGDKLIDKCIKAVREANFIEGAVTQIPFKDKFFDIVLCTEVIEHVEEPIKAVRELFRVVKPGGYIIITTPNKIYKPLFDMLSFSKIRRYQGNENWMYPWSLRKIIKDEGGKIKKEKYFNFIYPNKIFDQVENVGLLKYLMINQGYLVQV